MPTIEEKTPEQVSQTGPARCHNDISQASGIPPEEMRAETLDYIGDLLFELRKLAHNAGEPMVSYLIDMACQEAGTVQARNYYAGYVRAAGENAAAGSDGR